MSNHNLSFDFATPSSASRRSTSTPASRRQTRSASQAARLRSPDDGARDGAAVKNIAPKSAAARPAAVPKSKTAKAPITKSKTAKAPVEKTAAAKTASPRGRKTEAKPAGAVATKVSVARKVATAKAVKANAEKPVPEKPVPEKPAIAPKAKRVRAPKNLAAQYGETQSEDKARPTSEISLEPPKKSRRTAKARAKRQEAMQVDDELLQRLARVGSASSLVIGEEEEPVKARRSRIWEIMCGKCRHEQKAKTAATLCDGCGAILLREFARAED